MIDPAWHTRIAHALETLKEQGRYRSVCTTETENSMSVRRHGRSLINMSSNDYLGLSHHPALIEAVSHAVQESGCGAGASRLICGTLPLHDMLEDQLAALKGTGSALVTGSGFQTNASVLAALLDQGTTKTAPLVLVDRLAHASIHDGLKLAGVRQLRFRHNDLSHLSDLLKQHSHQSETRIIITESVFSMDGDRANLQELVRLATEHGALLYVDEAHATGVLGPDGAGLCADPVVKGKVDIVMGTFGKALGGYGAFVATSALLRAWLINHCRGFIYATALPPPVLAAALAALEILPSLENQRRYLLEIGNTLRSGLRQIGIDTLASDTQIIPAVIGNDHDTLAAASMLEGRGFLVVPIRPPTVPPGTGRLRIALSALHTRDHIDRLLDAFQAFARCGA
ncbi:8-amino-7-oxononanoate synthase [Haematospirillum jordaniae]|uniref:8-amino-7-ketopelargonate synthase n=2 Tax=Haematospirillum jordaniae TaxID=1549855 RepID=A0A143DGG7_9PROT|nr:8-amino-7-oxononanoate synthase [Haematospirillum jordaniae]AMW35393.1 8-amino-7-oxononanoate synthase [Haematospirillum jordaniae]NKD45527.1 8-amino-7-oxononanoate synthase [Haematospirillum jordaniae]NKD56177.1 8-amino-7-oxononanoate synthase [Haematospirillum jordaniae]NKD58235.1 8-amino-7-oxononanoate synthase [Haematospirillum jordaniae]NKD66594.1 8-amino-7-oxononanoate synthase [Haematospirillum jordaniae]